MLTDWIFTTVIYNCNLQLQKLQEKVFKVLVPGSTSVRGPFDQGAVFPKIITQSIAEFASTIDKDGETNF